jgi:hypothetical protein
VRGKCKRWLHNCRDVRRLFFDIFVFKAIFILAWYLLFLTRDGLVLTERLNLDGENAMKMKSALMTATLAAGLALAATAANAGPILVSTIDGGYDGPVYDTPYLVISNTTSYDFTGGMLKLEGYQGLNNGIVQSISLPTIAAGTSYTYVWLGATTPGNLFAYDYDDEWGNTPAGYTNPACVVGGGLCSVVGNFQTTFTATWANPAYGGGSGTIISSVFTPSINASGGFVGWLGLDPSGLSETVYDDHVGTPTGVLANIYVGPPTSLIPEPLSLSLFGAGLFGAAALRRRRKRSA